MASLESPRVLVIFPKVFQKLEPVLAMSAMELKDSVMVFVPLKELHG